MQGNNNQPIRTSTTDSVSSKGPRVSKTRRESNRSIVQRQSNSSVRLVGENSTSKSRSQIKRNSMPKVLRTSYTKLPFPNPITRITNSYTSQYLTATHKSSVSEARKSFPKYQSTKNLYNTINTKNLISTTNIIQNNQNNEQNTSNSGLYGAGILTQKVERKMNLRGSQYSRVSGSEIQQTKTSVSGYRKIELPPKILNFRTIRGEPTVTSIQKEPIHVEERIGEPVLIETIEHGTRVISEGKFKNKDLLVESLQRIILLSMENQRLVNKCNHLEAKNHGYENQIKNLQLSVRGNVTYENEIRRLQQERDEFERRINTYLAERSSMILEIEKLKSVQSFNLVEVETRISTLISENENLVNLLEEARIEASSVSSLNMKIEELEDNYDHVLNENERLQNLISEKDRVILNLEGGKQSLEGDLERLLDENKNLLKELKQMELDLESLGKEYEIREERLRHEYDGRLKHLQDENKRLVDKYNSLGKDYENFKIEYDKIIVKFTELEEEIGKLEHELKLKDITIEDKDERIAELENDRKRLQGKFDTMQENFLKLNKIMKLYLEK